MEYYNYNPNFVLDLLPKIRNGKVWYVAFLPLLGLFLENFAQNKWMGIILWLSILVIGPIVCISDEKDLRKFGVSSLQLYKARFFPPLYVYRRIIMTKQTKTPFVMLIIFMIWALLNNGFAASLKITDETFINMIQNCYTSSVTDLDENKVNNIIGERIDDFAQKDTVKWSYSEDDCFKYVTVSGLCNYGSKQSQKFEITFKLNYDGYKVKEITLQSASLSNIQLNQNKLKDFLNKVFIEEKETNNNINYTPSYKSV
ncbi:MAG: hypothetical protein ACI4I7_00765 [Oscillospiraceae bacterium]